MQLCKNLRQMIISRVGIEFVNLSGSEIESGKGQLQASLNKRLL